MGEQAPVFHLSTRMCGAHRHMVLAEVRSRLRSGLPVCLVSTQVIEAGVDVDFPVVFRALAPADSLVQSGGRCNREGMMGRLGRVVVFQPEGGGCPPGTYESDTALTRSFFVDVSPGCDRPRGILGEPASMTEYYDRLARTPRGATGMTSLVENSRKHLDFAETATHFRMIDSDSMPVIVTTYGPASDREALCSLLDSLDTDPAYQITDRDRSLLNMYTVALPPRNLYRDQSDVSIGLERIGVLHWAGHYDQDCGVIPTQPTKEASIW
jgi:CRISPR-associated endonuclease/helicase Cas3